MILRACIHSQGLQQVWGWGAVVVKKKEVPSPRGWRVASRSSDLNHHHGFHLGQV